LFRNLYLTKNSFSGSRKCYGENNRDEPLTYLKRNLLHFQHKLKNTNIHNADYQEIIKEYDSPTTLFYLDPPYSKNKKGWGYEHEVSLESLKDNLSKIEGDFIMSYDYSPDIVDEFKEYTIIEVDTKYETTQKYSTTKEIVVLKHQPNTTPSL
jgi:DNA adenine methylase